MKNHFQLKFNSLNWICSMRDPDLLIDVIVKCVKFYLLFLFTYIIGSEINDSIFWLYFNDILINCNSFRSHPQFKRFQTQHHRERVVDLFHRMNRKLFIDNNSRQNNEKKNGKKKERENMKLKINNRPTTALETIRVSLFVHDLIRKKRF